MTDRTDITQSLSLPHLLGLTPQLRHQIYLHLQMINEYGRPRVLDLNGQERFPKGEWAFHGLLLSCRTLYSEVSALLYSRNHFVIHYSDEGSLQPLRDLSDTSLAHLTSLKVVLNESSCHSKVQNDGFGRCCLELSNEGHSEVDADTWICSSHNYSDGSQSHGNAIRSLSASTSRMLEEWKLTAEHLSSRIASTKLDLSVVCDVLSHQEITAAHLAIAPISLLAPLKDCHIRLGRRPISQLQDMAQDAVLQARGISRADEPRLDLAVAPLESGRSASHLLALPRELRFRILEYTDLITPWREVTWSRQHHGYMASLTHCFNLESRGLECPFDIHHGCQFLRCWDTWPHASTGCFCRVRHAASSSRCKCWAPPTGLFLVCRALHADAQVVFFSGNRFVVHDLRASPPWYAPIGCDYPNETLAASQFLRKVVPSDCLSQLRFLEFVFPPYDSDSWPRDGHPALQEWADTIEWLKTQINAPGLTVRLVMADASEWGPSEERENMTGEAASAILNAYTRIVMPLVSLGSNDLGRFYAQFAWPWSWMYMEEARTRRKEEKLNERAERVIMGERYDEMLSRHDRPPPSIWLHRFARDA